MQYTTRDWRNRNRIKTPAGVKWLSIPVGADRNRLIYEVKLNDPKWQKKHFDTLKFAYGQAPYFHMYKDFLEYVYLDRTWEYLYELDQYITVFIAKEILGCHTQFADSRDFNKHGVKHERLLSLLENFGSNIIYESGPAAKDYIVPEDYQSAGIQLVWKNYEGYPEYRQLYGEFVHAVSILDLLFHVGSDAPEYIWGWRKKTGAKPWIPDE